MDPKLKLDDWVGRTVDVVIDRPMGSTHPRHSDIVYPLNYGYIPGTMAPDGHPIDAYVLGADYPLRRCSARVIAIVRRRDDVEDKLVVALSGEWSKASILESTAFQEQWFDTWLELPVGDAGRPLALGTAYRAAASALTQFDFSSEPADEIIAATSVVHDIPLLTRDHITRS